MGGYETGSSGKGLYGRVQGFSKHTLDLVVNPETRQRISTNITTFANKQPYLALFVLTQLILSFTPVALFVSFVAATVLISSITALLFSLFWIGAALLVLVPTIFITASLGVAVWVWLVCSFLIVRWIYNMIPISVRGGMEVDVPNVKTMVINKTGDSCGDVDAEIEPTKT